MSFFRLGIHYFLCFWKRTLAATVVLCLSWRQEGSWSWVPESGVLWWAISEDSLEAAAGPLVRYSVCLEGPSPYTFELLGVWGIHKRTGSRLRAGNQTQLHSSLDSCLVWWPSLFPSSSWIVNRTAEGEIYSCHPKALQVCCELCHCLSPLIIGHPLGDRHCQTLYISGSWSVWSRGPFTLLKSIEDPESLCWLYLLIIYQIKY